MKKTGLRLLCLSILLCQSSLLGENAKACSRVGAFTFSELFGNADVIVRATAVKYDRDSGNTSMRSSEPDSTIEFKVEEILRGKDVPDIVVLNGYLTNQDDYNEVPVPYTFVRPGGRMGNCFAFQYKQGAQFLLFLKKVDNKYTSNISALGPSNEQLRSKDDPWLRWVQDQLRKPDKPKQQSSLRWRGSQVVFLLGAVWTTICSLSLG